MCAIDIELENGKLEINCKYTGKPITITNEYGMFCEEKCYLDKAKEAKNRMDAMIKVFNENYNRDSVRKG